LTRLPKFFKLCLVSQRVHGLPKASMAKGYQLAIGSQRSQWITLPTGVVARNPVNAFWGENEISPIDQAAVATGLLAKACNRCA
jgi:hypothetical protein